MIDWLRAPAADPTIQLAGRDVPIHIAHHPRARRLTLRLAPDGGAVRITMPRWCRRVDALAFAAVRKAWLEGQLASVPPRTDPLRRGTLRYRGREIAIVWEETASRRPVFDGDALSLGGPRETAGGRLQRWLEAEALHLATADLAHYCRRAAVSAADLKLTRAARRWGSCSTSGIVRINWRLVMAPDHVRRSVVAHEVAHLVHFHHGPGFHTFLAALFEDDIAEADAWLRTHGRALYSEFG